MTVVTVSDVGDDTDFLNTGIDLFLSVDILSSSFVMIMSMSAIMAVRCSYSYRVPTAFLTIWICTGVQLLLS